MKVEVDVPNSPYGLCGRKATVTRCAIEQLLQDFNFCTRTRREQPSNPRRMYQLRLEFSACMHLVWLCVCVCVCVCVLRACVCVCV